MKKGTLSEAKSRRQLAEELLRKSSSEITSIPSKDETLKLIHELQVKQIELELQNEELMMAKAAEYESASKYVELYNSAPSGYLTVSKEGKILEVNLTGAKMLGKDRRIIKNCRLEMFVSDESKQVLNDFILRAFRTNDQESCEVNLINESNQPLYVYLTGFVRKWGKQCLITMVDVTDNKIAREEKDELMKRMRELIETNKELSNAEKELKEKESKLVQLVTDKDRFISILGHDLRSPFSGLLGLSELLRGNVRKFDLDEIEVFANYINSSAQLTYNLLENLLIWGKSQSGRVPFNPQKVVVWDAISNVLQLLESGATAKKITINYTGSEDLMVMVDIEMFKTIMRNLISNAIKFTNKNGTINISCEKGDSGITISVADNGIGIKPDNLKRLFDISQIYTTVGTAEEEGSGLGLLICKDFVEKNGGTIGIESTVGQGSKFYFTLPGEDELKKKNEESTEDRYSKIKNLKILIVDDDKASRMILSLTVKSLSKETLYAVTGLEAISTCKSNPDIDLILMDIKMPEIDGLEATRQIRLFNKEVIIIIQTAFSLSYEKDKAIEAGCNDFISKPIDKAVLFELIGKYFTK